MLEVFYSVPNGHQTLKACTLLHAHPRTHTPTCVRVGQVEEVGASVQVGEGPDSEAVRGVELSGEKLATRSLHLLQLEKTCGWQQHLHTRTYTRRELVHLFILPFIYYNHRVVPDTLLTHFHVILSFNLSVAARTEVSEHPDGR